MHRISYILECKKQDAILLQRKESNSHILASYNHVAVAQLVERLPSKQEAAGSKPVRDSTPWQTKR